MTEICELCHQGPNPVLGLRIESWTGKAHVNCVRLLRSTCYYDKDEYTSLVKSKTVSKCDYCGKKAALAKCRDLNCTKSFHLSCVLAADGSIEFEKLVILCKDHKCKKINTKLGKCCKCDNDVVDREGFLLLCCSSHLHVRCARDLISSNSDKCPSCLNKEDYEIDLQMNGVYVPATQQQTQFIQQFTKCIQESKHLAKDVIKNKSAKTTNDKSHKATNGVSYEANDEDYFGSNESIDSSNAIKQFTKVTEKRDVNNKDKMVGYRENAALTYETVTIHTDDSDTGSCSSGSIISIHSSNSGRSSIGRRRTEKWVTRNTQKLTLPQDKKDDTNTVEKDDVIIISGPNSPASSISSFSSHKSPGSPFSSLNSPLRSYSNLNSPLSSVSSIIGPTTKESEDTNHNAADDGNITKAADDGNLTKAADDGNLTKAADDGNLIKAVDDGNLTKAVVDKNNTQTVYPNEDLEELDVEASQNMSKQISQSMGQFKSNKESSNLGITGIMRLSDTRRESSKSYSMDMVSVFRDEFCDDEMRDEINESDDGEADEDADDDDDADESKNLPKKSSITKKKNFAAKTAKQRPNKVKGDSERFELTNTSDKSKSTSKPRKKSTVVYKEQQKSIEDLDQIRSDEGIKGKRKSRKSAEFAKESLKSRKPKKVAKDLLEQNKGKRKRLSIEKNKDVKKARLSLEENDRSEKSTTNASKKEPKACSSQKKKKRLIVNKDISERSVIHGRNGVPWNQSTQPFLPECYDGVPQLIRNNINEFVDVNRGEKRILELWNDFIVRRSSIGFIHLHEICAQFIKANGSLIVHENLYRNCLLHFTNMEQSGMIDSITLIRLLGQLQTYVEEEEAIKTGYLDDLLKDAEDEYTDTSDTSTHNSNDDSTNVSLPAYSSPVIRNSTSENSVLKTVSNNSSNEDHVEYIESFKVIDEPILEDCVKDDPNFVDSSIKNQAENSQSDKGIVNSSKRDSYEHDICDNNFVNNITGDNSEDTLHENNIGECLEDIDLESAPEMITPTAEEIIPEEIDKNDDDLNQVEGSNESVESGKDYLADISSNYENRIDDKCSKKGPFENSSPNDFGAAFKRFLSERSKGEFNF